MCIYIYLIKACYCLNKSYLNIVDLIFDTIYIFLCILYIYNIEIILIQRKNTQTNTPKNPGPDSVMHSILHSHYNHFVF